MREYTVAASVAVVLVVLVELLWLRTGIFRRRAYWASMIIVFGFQVLVDGWLTKLSAPIVIYAADQNSGVRFPWDIPIEDFPYGFALVTLTIMLWTRRPAPDRPASAGRSTPSRSTGRGPGT